MSLQVLLIEHEDVGGLYPFSVLHCSWELRVGAFTTLERWQAALPECTVTTCSHRHGHMQSFFERHPHSPPFVQQPTLIVIGNVLLSPTTMRNLASECERSTQPILLFCESEVIGAYIPHSISSPSDAQTHIDMLQPEACRSLEVAGDIVTRIWQTLDLITECINWDATLLSHTKHPSASIHPSVIINEEHGRVIIRQDAQVGALTVLIGPTVIGESVRVREHSVIQDSVIGIHSRVAGEIRNSIFSGYANKQHYGFLGHSFVSEWVNLGAGTTTSNLKNTYGHIRVQMPWLTEDTHRMFLGAIIGDHSKLGIGTMTPTGFMCGVANNIVVNGYAPKSVGHGEWITPEATTHVDVSKGLKSISTVMARRLREVGEHERALLTSVLNNHA